MRHRFARFCLPPIAFWFGLTACGSPPTAAPPTPVQAPSQSLKSATPPPEETVAPTAAPAEQVAGQIVATALPTGAPNELSPTQTPVVVAVPEWMKLPLQDASTGVTFTLADFPGQVLIVESMAVWCTNCRQQQRVVAGLLPELGPDVRMISLDVDLNESAELLAAYSAQNGFDWTFAVATFELTRMLAETYGPAILNPPSVPMLFVDASGQPHLAEFGHKDAETLQALVQSYRE